MSYIFLFVSMVVSNASMVSGPVREDWVRRYHGPGYGDDYATAMTVDSEGNVYVTGGSFGRPNYHEYTTLKYDRDGNELWSARYHSSYGHVGDDPAAIAVDAMGNVYVTGTICVQALFKGSCTTSAYGTIKYNPQGGLLWAAEYHWPTAGNDFALAIAVDSEGNAFVTGRDAAVSFLFRTPISVRITQRSNTIPGEDRCGPSDTMVQAEASTARTR